MGTEGVLRARLIPHRFRSFATRVLHSTPAAVWLLAVLAVALANVYGALTPPLRAPDETAHLDMVRAVAGGKRYPGLNQRFVSQQMLEFHRAYQQSVPGARWTSEQAFPRDERSTFADFGPDVPSPSPNQLTQHPPLYYVLLGPVYGAGSAVLNAAGADSAERRLWLIRFASSLLVAVVPIATFHAGRRLGQTPPVAITTAMGALSVPGMLFLFGVVNNDNLLTATTAVVLMLSADVISRGATARNSLLLGLAVGIALFTKGTSLFMVPWALFAFGIAAGRTGNLRRTAFHAFLMLGAAFISGGWWWAKNLWIYGVVQPTVELRAPAPAGFQPDFVLWLNRYAYWVRDNFWAGFGAAEGHLPTEVVLVASAAGVFLFLAGIFATPGRKTSRPAWALALMAGVLAGVGIWEGHFDVYFHGAFRPGVWFLWPSVCAAVLLGGALAVERRRISPARLATTLYLLIPLAATAVVIALGAWHGYQRTGQFEGLGGRYFYPAAVALSPGYGFGLMVVLRSEQWRVVVIAAALMITVQVAGVATMLAVFWGPHAASFRDAIAAAAAWSPWGWLVFLLPWLASLVVLGGIAITVTCAAVPTSGQPGRSVAAAGCVLCGILVAAFMIPAVMAHFRTNVVAATPLQVQALKEAAKRSGLTDQVVEIAGLQRRVIRIGKGGRIVVTTQVPARQGVELAFVAGTPLAAWQEPGLVTVFRLTVTDISGHEMKMERSISSRNLWERTWVPVAFSLQPWAGTKVSLLVEVLRGDREGHAIGFVGQFSLPQ